MGTKYKRVLLKISGEALLGNQQFGIDYEPVEMIANEIKSIYDRLCRNACNGYECCSSSMRFEKN